ncbi:MAG: CHAT domain-containing protein [Phycisphaerales bacterium]
MLDQIEVVLTRKSTRPDELRALASDLKQLALTDLKQAVTIAERLASLPVADDALAVDLLTARAHVLSYATRFDDATSLLTQAARIADRTGDIGALAQVRLTAVQPLARAGRFEEAQHAAEAACDAFSARDDSIGQGKSKLNLGIVLRMRGLPSDALQAFNAALPMLAEEPLLLGALFSNRAEAMLDLDLFGEAEESFLAAREAFSTAGNEHGAAIVEGNLADLFAREGRLDAALERFELARQHFEASGATADVARLDAESAEAMAMLGARDAAITTLSQCLPQLSTAGLVREWRRGQFALAWCLLTGGHDGSARDVIHALLGNLGPEEPVLRAQCELVLAVLDIRFGRAATSDRASAILEALGDRPLRLAQAHAWLADAMIRAGNFDRADTHLQALGASRLAMSMSALRAQHGHLSGRLLQARKKTAEAAEVLREAMLEAERIRGALRADRWRTACGQSWRDAYLDAMSASLDSGDVGNALDALERVRGRSLHEAMGSQALARAQDPELHEKLEALNVQYARLEADGDASSMAAKIAQLEDGIERLRIRRDAVGQPRPLSVDPLPLETIRERLPRGAAILEYFQEGRDVGVFVLRSDGVRVHRCIAGEQQVRSGLSRLLFAVEFAVDDEAERRASGEGEEVGPRNESEQRANSQLWRSAADNLSRLLLHPLAPDLEGIDTLAISRPASLEGVPWAALPWGESMLLAQFVVRSTPSASVAVRPRESVSLSDVLAVGVDDALAPRMGEEAALVAQQTIGHALIGRDATTKRVLAAIETADVVHLATHCVFSPRHPMASRLKLADRWLSAYELAAAIRPGARIVLAGCETGRAGGVNTEDRTGLVSALLANGAAEVLSTHWPLHDSSAARIFEAMYAQLTSGSAASLAQALGRAQLQAEREGMSPWHFAALHVTGGMT